MHYLSITVKLLIVRFLSSTPEAKSIFIRSYERGKNRITNNIITDVAL